MLQTLRRDPKGSEQSKAMKRPQNPSGRPCRATAHEVHLHYITRSRVSNERRNREHSRRERKRCHPRCRSTRSSDDAHRSANLFEGRRRRRILRPQHRSPAYSGRVAEPENAGRAKRYLRTPNNIVRQTLLEFRVSRKYPPASFLQSGRGDHIVPSAVIRELHRFFLV